jgi:NTP pyrophosphatase (non-canonical NTP hydrolase)
MKMISMLTSNPDKTELEEYQEWVSSVSAHRGLHWAILGLNAEAGEVAGVLEKDMRKCGKVHSDGFEHDILDELGDVLWYAAEICNVLEITLDEVIEHNIEKINRRVYGQSPAV